MFLVEIPIAQEQGVIFRTCLWEDFSLCIYVCIEYTIQNVYTWVCGFVHLCTHTRRKKKCPVPSFSLRQDFWLNPEFNIFFKRWSIWPVGSSDHLSPPPRSSTGLAGVLGNVWLLMWVPWIWTHVLMFDQAVLLSVEPPPNPLKYFLTLRNHKVNLNLKYGWWIQPSEKLPLVVDRKEDRHPHLNNVQRVRDLGILM